MEHNPTFPHSLVLGEYADVFRNACKACVDWLLNFWISVWLVIIKLCILLDFLHKYFFLQYITIETSIIFKRVTGKTKTAQDLTSSFPMCPLVKFSWHT